METNNLKNQHLRDTAAVHSGNCAADTVNTALCSRLPYQPASVTVMEMRIEQGIAQSNPGGNAGEYEPGDWA